MASSHTDIDGPSKTKLLYVDDEEINLINFRLTFDEEYRVLTAKSGAEALGLMEREGDIAIVVADQRMIGMTGVELLERIYRRDPDAIRVILTAYTEVEDILGAINKGHVYSYVLKPWDENALRVTLARARETYLLTKTNRELTDRLEEKNRALRRINAELQTINTWLQDDIEERSRIEESLKLSLEQTRALSAELAAKNEELEAAYAELKESQEQVVQQEKLATLGQLAAGVAHELNNPIGYVASNLNSLARYFERLCDFLALESDALRRSGDPETVAEVERQRKQQRIDVIVADLANLIHESLDGTERVTSIARDLKSFSRGDQGEQELVDINECLESTINVAWNEIKYRATVERDYGELPPLLCHPQQLNQVFMNLLINAAQAIDCQGTISVRTRHNDGEIAIAIADTGSGIAPDHRDRLFEPFFTTKARGQGTGLGLPIARDIVHKHHGTIEVASEPAHGTTFTIRLPLPEGHGALTPAPAARRIEQ